MVSGAITYSLAGVRQSNRAERVTTQNIVAAASARVAGFEVRPTVRINSGLPYYPLQNAGTGVVSPPPASGFFGTLSKSHLPWTKTLDLEVARTLVLSGRQATFFVDARNLLNTRNLIALFAETGADSNALFRSAVLDPENYNLASQAPPGTRQPDGTIDLGMPCAAWQREVSCVALRRVEGRFGNGDGLFTPAEQDAAFGAYYDAFYGPSRFYAPGRTLRIGVEVR